MRKSLKWILPKELSALSSVTLAEEIIVDSSELSFTDLRVSGSNAQGLEIKITGLGRIEDFSNLQPFSDLNLAIRVSSPDSHSLQGYLPGNLSELGPVRGSLRAT
ncbi:hypothetical protein KAI46_03140 [bacterium]|nr:hypothetical protein [bacterium]